MFVKDKEEKESSTIDNSFLARQDRLAKKNREHRLPTMDTMDKPVLGALVGGVVIPIPIKDKENQEAQ